MLEFAGSGAGSGQKWTYHTGTGTVTVPYFLSIIASVVEPYPFDFEATKVDNILWGKTQGYSTPKILQRGKIGVVS